MPTKKKETEKVYCGTGTKPKNRKVGSMDECINAGQVRKYGQHEVPLEKLLDKEEEDKKRKTMKKIEKLEKDATKLYDLLKT